MADFTLEQLAVVIREQSRLGCLDALAERGIGTAPAPTPVPTPTPTPTEPTPVTLTTLVGSDTLQVVNYVKDGFDRGVNATTFELAIPAKYALRNYADLINTRTGRGLNIMAKAPYRLDGDVMLVNIGVALNPDTEGYPNYVFVRNREVPAQVPPPPPATGEPAPSEPVKTVDVSLSPDTSITGGDWVNGNWTQTAIARQSFKLDSRVKVGQTVITGDGVTRKVTMVEPFTTNMSVTYDGAKIDPVKIAGKPTVFKFPEGTSTTPAPVPTPTPVPTPVPVEGTFIPRTVGRIYLNLGMGAGADKVIPGSHGTNFTFATRDEIFYWRGLGFEEFRVGFLMGRVFKYANKTEMYQGVDVNDKTRKYTIDEIIRLGEDCYDAGATYMLDNHVYAHWPSNGATNKVEFGTAGYTPEMFANHIYAILMEIKKSPKAWKALKRFDLVNEPYTANMTAKALCRMYKAAQDKCWEMAEHVIFVYEGPSYSSMRNWATLVGDDFDPLLNDPRGREYVEFSAHGYLDRGADGYYDENGDGVLNTLDDILSDKDKAAGVTFDTLADYRSQGWRGHLKAKNVNGNIGENIVSGDLPQLLHAEELFLKGNIDRGINTYLFGAGRGFGSGNAHNIALTNSDTGSKFDNSKMLALALKMIKYQQSLLNK